MDHNLCQKVVSKDTKTDMVSDTIEFRHHKLTLSSVTPEDKVLHGVQKLTAALKNTLSSTVYSQLQAIKALQDTIEHWEWDTKEPMATTYLPRRTLSTKKHQAPRVPTAKPGTPPEPRVKPPPRVQTISTKDIPANHRPISQRLRSQSDPKQLESATMTEQPVAYHTRYRTTQQTLRVHPVLAAQRNYPEKLLNLWYTLRPKEHTAMPFLENETWESLEYSQLLLHPKYKEVWNTSYSNELGRILQDVGSGTSGAKKQRVKGTDTF